MSATMAKKKKTDRHKGVPVLLRVSPDLKEALQRYADEERRSVAQAGALLLEEILEQKGYWPPGAGKAEAEEE
jgi:hypothetical protein